MSIGDVQHNDFTPNNETEALTSTADFAVSDRKDDSRISDAIGRDAPSTNLSGTIAQNGFLSSEIRLHSNSSVNNIDSPLLVDSMMLGRLKQGLLDDEVRSNNNHTIDSTVPSNINQLHETIGKNCINNELTTMQKNNNRTLDIFAYHKGREKYDIRNEGKHLLHDAKSMIATVTVEIPLCSSTVTGGGDIYRETIQWDLSNVTMPTPMVVATQMGQQFGLTYPMIWDLANSIQIQLQNYVNDNCTYTSPVFDGPELAGGTHDNRKTVTTVPQLYGAVTGFIQVGGTCMAPVSRCKAPPTTQTSTTNCGESLTVTGRSLSGSQRSISNGSIRHQPNNSNKSRMKVEPTLALKSGRRVVPKLPMSEFPKEVTQGMEMDAGFDVEYRTLFTAEGSFLVTNDVGGTNDTSPDNAVTMSPIVATASHSEIQVAPLVEDGSVDFCNVCKTVGNLLCCDFCPRAFHCQCISSDAIPESMNDESKWECPSCIIERDGLPDDNITEAPVFEKLVAVYQVDVEDSTSLQHATVLSIIHEMLQKLMNYDFGDMFRSPVNCREIPTYKTIVKNPMDLGTISKNLEKGHYKSSSFEGIVLSALKDVELVWHNCFIFNVEGSAVYRMANIHKRRAFSIRQCSFDHLLSDQVKTDLATYVSTLELERDNHRRLDALTNKSRQLTSMTSPTQSRHKISGTYRPSAKGRPIAILDAESGRIMKIYSSMQATSNAVNFITSLKRHECEWDINEINTLNRIRSVILRSNSDPNLRLFGYRWVCLDELRTRRVKFGSRTITTTQPFKEANVLVPKETVREEFVELVSEGKSFLFYSVVEALSFPSLPGNTSDLRVRLEALVSGTDFETIDGNMWKRSDVQDLETFGIEYVKEDTITGETIILCGFVDIVAAHEDWSQAIDASVGSDEDSRSLDTFSRLFLDQDRTVDGLRWRRLHCRIDDSSKGKPVVQSKSMCDSTINTSASVSGVRQDTSSTDTHSTNNSTTSHVYDLETVSSPNRKAHVVSNFLSPSKRKGFNELRSGTSIVPLPLSDNCDSFVDGTDEAPKH